MSNQGKGYNENFFNWFATILSSGLKVFNTRLYGTSGTTIDAIQTDGAGNIRTTNPADEYTLAYTGDRLDSVTRTSDSKVITLTYTGDNLTGVSDWA